MGPASIGAASDAPGLASVEVPASVGAPSPEASVGAASIGAASTTGIPASGTGSATHSLSGSVFAGTGEHLPTLGVTSQRMQTPSHGTSQQTPSEQAPPPHWAAVVHGVPSTIPASFVACPSAVTFASFPPSPPPSPIEASGPPVPPESKSPRSEVQWAVPRAMASAATIRSARPVETETGIISLIQGTRRRLATDPAVAAGPHAPTSAPSRGSGLGARGSGLGARGSGFGARYVASSVGDGCLSAEKTRAPPIRGGRGSSLPRERHLPFSREIGG